MDIQRTVLWIALAIVSYLMVLAWNEDYQPTSPNPTTAQQQTASQSTGDADLTAPDPDATDDEFATPETTDQPSVASGKSAPSEPDSGQTITVTTDVLKLTIDRVGGNIIGTSLLKYRADRNDPEPLKLLQNNPRLTYRLESALIGRDGPDGRNREEPPVYQAKQSSYQLGDDQDTLTVDLVLEARDGVTITKRYTLNRDSYEIDVRYRIDNQSDDAWQGNLAGKIVRDQSGDPTAQNTLGIQSFLGMVLSTPEDPYEKYDFGDLSDNPINRSVEGGWVAFLQHYFLSAWVPSDEMTHQYQTTRRNNLQVMGFVSQATSVAPGEQQQVGARAYIGPKVIERLETVAPNLDRTVDFGFLFFIAHPLFVVLDWFHSLVGNWGVSIILLTVSVKLLFFKLSATSYRSMARMRAVAPQLTRLRELYGDDRQRMSQEMMALYKREKINPLGGCLPILVQMPVFISLYWVLFESVQLRHAPFMLWINDLSVMDPYFILPLLMGASMFLQMQLNPTPPDPMQAKLMKMMPVMFTVFFLWFPAGLVLYWLVNNILSIAQQWYITRQITAEGTGKGS
ncbi:protein translocase subunit yidC [Tamilnaduibacter salinus]|uniref:Membrane protein insertase YidC n=1 Tax=Tamilnaduibacter salinus TaxID=1484056 RepID=A0A2A2I6X3_9GAMM|nr:membrane protein insertase YidC [Tamilnaduibacter salinus]PAV26880.1 membrane protein insertase YidC [Tamilnaduibacter salinus]PVY77469.1 protein translocase subunit yidC [Tamilnaduibacter salinus]